MIVERVLSDVRPHTANPNAAAFWESLVILDQQDPLDFTANSSSPFIEPFIQTSSAPVIVPFAEMTIVPEARSPFETTSSERVPTIFDFYSVEAEAQFLKDHATLTEAERMYYIRESVSQFLNEFAGNVPYSSITYLQKPDGLYYGSMKANELYRKTAQVTSGESREWAEYEGFLRVEEALEKFDEVIWYSPPRIANYAFAFRFKSTGSVVRMTIVRYPEKMYDVSKTCEVAEKVTGISYNFSHAHHFLTQPMAVGGDVLPTLLEASGTSEKDIKKAVEFERRVSVELIDWMSEYYVQLSACHGIINLEKKEELETLIAAMYNQACEIREEIHREGLQRARLTETQSLQIDRKQINSTARSRALSVSGGGSCPTVKRSGFLSQSDIAEALGQGMPLERKLLENELVESENKCKTCGANAEDNHYHCGNRQCRKKYESELHRSSHERTKKCECGFKFNC